MYAYIEGTISELNPAYAVIDCGGVGYEINISLNTYSQIKDKSKAKLWVKQIVREDALLLFGFSDLVEKKLFMHLLSVSGVGANTARVILSTLSPKETAVSILNGDVKKIQSVKGIGTKTAQRIIVDLRDKLGKEDFSSSIPNAADLYPSKEEALSALVMLGFSKISTEKVLDTILSSQSDLTSESLIKQALRML
ncbi:MAG: Holliday junction branch migration protein RuvA [Bacteroidales bacterium]